MTVPNNGYLPLRFYHLKTGEVSDIHGDGLILNKHIRYYCVQSITKLMELTEFGNINIRGAMKKRRKKQNENLVLEKFFEQFARHK